MFHSRHDSLAVEDAHNIIAILALIALDSSCSTDLQLEITVCIEELSECANRGGSPSLVGEFYYVCIQKLIKRQISQTAEMLLRLVHVFRFSAHRKVDLLRVLPITTDIGGELGRLTAHALLLGKIPTVSVLRTCYAITMTR
jgi:hypothetical protein